MEGGRFLMEGRPKDLIMQEVGPCVMEVMDPDGQELEGFLASRGDQVERSADRIYVYSQQCQIIQSEFRERFPDVYSMVRPATLENVYLKLTGRRLRD
jgi:lipooligosaccharide transport system ATP-binding protein